MFEAEFAARGEPARRHRTQELAQLLLSCCPVASAVQQFDFAAYLPLEETFQFVVGVYATLGWFEPLRDEVLFKFSADNREILSRWNQALFFQPLSVWNPQSVDHVVTYAFADVSEEETVARDLYRAVDLDAFLRALPQRTLFYRGCMRRLNYIYVADWVTHTTELRCMIAGSRADSAHVCIACRACKGELRHDWFADPFKLVAFDRAADDFPASVLPSVPPSRRRYCWLHGTARLLSNALAALFDLLPLEERGAFAATVRTMRRAWQPDTPAAAFTLKQTKRFLRSDVYNSIARLFINVSLRLAWPTDALPPLDSVGIVRVLLLSIRAFLQFSSVPHPTAHDFATLWKARTVVLGFHAAQQLAQAPTTHYMCNHAVTLAATDGTAYYTQQEAIEHENEEDMDGSRRISFGPASRTRLRHTAACQELDNAQLMRAVRALRSALCPENAATAAPDPEPVDDLIGVPSPPNKPVFHPHNV